MNNKAFILLIIGLVINITPASAVEVGQLYSDLDELKNSDEIQTIQKWNNGGGWYRFWHFAGFCDAAYKLSSKADDIKAKVSELNSTLNATYGNTTTIKDFYDKQGKLDSDLDSYLSGNGSHSSPQTAVDDANYIASELKTTNKTINVDVNENIKAPQNGDLVQLISSISTNTATCTYNLEYWLYKGVKVDDDTGESMVQLYNGQEYVTIPLATFNKRFTGVVLNVKDITTNSNTTVENQTNPNTTTVNKTANTVNTKTAPKNQTVTAQNVTNGNRFTAQLCSTVQTIQTIQLNYLNSMKNLIPAYNQDLVNLLNLLALIFGIIGTLLWVVGGILCATPLVPLGVVLCIVGGLLCTASIVMLYYVSCMKDSKNDVITLDNMITDLNSHTVP